LRVCKGDAQRAAGVLAGLTTGASLFEFVATPLLGRLSDRYGRRPFLVAAPLICCAARLVTYACADGNLRAVVAANWIDRCFSGSAFPLFLTVARASITDLVLGEELTKAMTGLAAIAGLAVSLSPFTGALLMQKYGNPKYAALAAAAVSAAHALYVWRNVEETLEPEKRKGVELEGCNPFSFTQFFRDRGATGRHMRLLSWVALLLAFPTEMHDTRMVLLKTKLGFGVKEIGLYMLAVGASIMASGVAAKVSIGKLGQVSHTHLAATAAVASLLAWASAKGGRDVALACAFSVLGGTAASGVKSMLTTLAVDRGMGRGQIAASLANMTTLTKVVAPLAFASLFARFGQRAPFLAAAGFIVAAEAMFSGAEGKRAAASTVALGEKLAREKKEEKEEGKEK